MRCLVITLLLAFTLAGCGASLPVSGEVPDGIDADPGQYLVTVNGDGTFTAELYVPVTPTPTPAPTPTPTVTPTVTPTPTPTVTPTVTPTPTPTVTPTPTPTPTPTGVANVVAYGAKAGDGSDDSAAFTAACRTGLPVYVPAGTYDAGTITVPANVTLYGDGDASWVRASFRFNSSITLRDLRIGDAGDSHGPATTTTSGITFERVSFRGGGSGGGVIGWNNRAVSGLVFDSCTFERNQGVWSSSGGSGALWFAVDTADGTIIRDVTIRGCHFLGQPTYGIVFWQSEDSGSGYWGDILIEDNVFEVTAEFTLDFDGLLLADLGHNDVVIRGNTIKGAGLPHSGVDPSWPYGICVEPARYGTIIEGNTIGRCFKSAMKFTKDASECVFRGNTIDYRTANGVDELYWPDYFRVVNVFEGYGNQVTGNTILLPSSPTPSSSVINDVGDDTIISGNQILRGE